VIDTIIESPVWSFGGRERQAQAVLFDALEVPLRVELILTKDWERQLFDTSLAQYLPCGELIGAIPARQPSGSWARVIGLALMNFWRRKPQDTLNGALTPTRRELLTRYTPSTAIPEDVLNGDKPGRAIGYWTQALAILMTQGILEKTGEAALTAAKIKANLPRQEWRDSFLNGEVKLCPGPAIIDAIKKTAEALPKAKPRKLAAKTARKKR
jgi:hypothetical protein